MVMISWCVSVGGGVLGMCIIVVGGSDTGVSRLVVLSSSFSVTFSFVVCDSPDSGGRMEWSDSSWILTSSFFVSDPPADFVQASMSITSVTLFTVVLYIATSRSVVPRLAYVFVMPL